MLPINNLNISPSFDQIRAEKKALDDHINRLNPILMDCVNINEKEREVVVISFSSEFKEVVADSKEVLLAGAKKVVSFFNIFDTKAEASSPPFTETCPPTAKKMRIVGINQNLKEKIISLRDQCSKIHNDILCLEKEYGKANEDDHKQRLQEQLFQLEIEFEDVRHQLLSSSCDLLRPLLGDLVQFEGEEGIKDLKSGIQNEIDILAKDEGAIAQANARKNEIQGLLQAFKSRLTVEKMAGLQQLTRMYLIEMEPIELSLINLIRTEFASLNDFTHGSESRVTVKKYETDIQLELGQFTVKLNRLRDILNPKNQVFNYKKVEKECIELQLELHFHRVSILQQLTRFPALKQKILKEDIFSHSNNQKPEELRQTLTNLTADSTKIARTLRIASDQLQQIQDHHAHNQSSSFLTNLANIFESEHVNYHTPNWSVSPWGLLLIGGVEKRTMQDDLGIGFKNTVNTLYSTRRQIQKKLVEVQDQTEVQALTQELNHLNRVLYHTLLTRIIDQVGCRQRLLKKHGDTLTPQEKVVLEFEIKLLDNKFDSVFKKFKETPLASKSLLSAALNYTFDIFKTVVTFGYVNETISSPQELKREKQYADLGYNMAEDLRAWIASLTVKDNESIASVLKREVDGFMKWAETDPKTAMAMARDMAQTAAIVGSDSYKDQFISTMRVKAYGAAFQEGWNPFPTEDSAPTEEALKYYSLSQLFRCAPVLTAVLKSLATSDYSNPIGVVLKTGLEAVKSHAVQKTSDFIPEEHAAIALHALNILNGKGYQEILEEQRNIELFRLGGTAAQFLNSPTEFLKRVKYEAKIWFKTVQQSHGTEKAARLATQILLPLGAALLSAAAITAVILGGPVSWITALTFSFTTISLSVATVRKTEGLFAKAYATRKNVVDQLKEEAKTFAAKSLMANIVAERKSFIKKLKKDKVLPVIKRPALGPIGEQVQVYEQVKDQALVEFKRRLETQLATVAEPTATDCVQIFKSQVLDQLGGYLIAEIAKSDHKGLLNDKTVRTDLANDVVKSLMKDWLNGKIDEIFSKRVVDYSQQKKKKPKTEGTLDSKAYVRKALAKENTNPDINIDEVLEELELAEV